MLRRALNLAMQNYDCRVVRPLPHAGVNFAERDLNMAESQGSLTDYIKLV